MPKPSPTPTLRNAILPALAFIAFLWLLFAIDALLLPAATKPGVTPRSLFGLIGIALAPLVHASFAHLISNTFPLALLGAGMLYFYPKAARRALPFLYFAPGVGVWIFARDATHIGASGLAYGMLFFVLVIGVRRKDRIAVAFSLAVLFLYGGMLLGLLPEDAGTSFEYHLFGALTGAITAYILHKKDPKPPPEKYHDEEEDDPIIGDEWRLPEDEIPHQTPENPNK